MNKFKNILCINDISGIGKCSLTVILPILSVMGIQTSVIPTAVLSSNTGCFGKPVFIDITKNLKQYINHWENLNIKFDAIYSGYLASKDQINIVIEIIKKFTKKDTIILIDPVMADNGKLYSLFDLYFVEEMKKLCSYADIITPNVTEASFLINKKCYNINYEKNIVDDMLYKLTKLGAKNIVLTGIDFKDKIAVAIINNKNINYIAKQKIKGNYYGTGDIFNSVLLGCILNNIDLKEACNISCNFLYESIKLSNDYKIDTKFGISFEKILYKLGNYIENKVHKLNTF